MIKINGPVSRITGTAAFLLEGDTLQVRELLYGMLLPSGNDAAVALGSHFGGIIENGGKKDPEIVISPEAIERRLRAYKIEVAQNYKELLDKGL